MQRNLKQQHKKHKATLYRCVFDTVSVKFAISFLFIFFLLHPVIPVFAADEEVASTTDPVVQVVDQEEAVSVAEPEEIINEPLLEIPEESSGANTQKSTSSPPVDEPVLVNIEATSEDSIAPKASTTLENNNATTSIVSSGGNNSSESESSTSLESSTTTPGAIEPSFATSSDEVATTTASTTVDTQQTVDDSEATTDNNTDDELHDSDITTVISSSTVEIVATSTEVTKASSTSTTTPAASFVQIASNNRQFSDSDCVNVGDGAFYCSTNKEAPKYIQDGVFEAPDVDGDKEIFIRIGNKDIQITHNEVDDASPYYDAVSKRIVWHSMKNNRFQIASYDFSTAEIQYLTDSTYNNMQPVAYGDVTLWQAWLDDNWEIVKYEDGTTTRLTNNQVNDIAPLMESGHIFWQTQFLDEWRIAVYDTGTQSVEYIENQTGSNIENPRMIFVYDATDENGDIQTLGYDFDSRSTFSLGSLPGSIPEKLPDPEQTGETRALIQSKNTSREGSTDEIEPVPDNNPTATSSTPQVSGHTLDLSTASSSTQATASTTATAPAVTDLIIEKIVEEISDVAASSTTHIKDVVIPPTFSTSTPEVG